MPRLIADTGVVVAAVRRELELNLNGIGEQDDLPRRTAGRPPR